MKRLPTFSRLILTACAAWCLLSASTASAQEMRVETVSVNADEGIARIRVHRGAQLRDLNGLARRHATVPGLHLTMEQIEELNPGQVISVCFDNLPGERPMMSRSSELYQSCEDYRRTRWLVAGATYTVPLRPPAAVVPESDPAPATIVDDGRVEELETEIADLEADLAVANRMLEVSTEQNGRLLDELDVATALPPADTHPQPTAWQLSLLFVVFLLGMGWVWYSEVRKTYQDALKAALKKQNDRFLKAIANYQTAYKTMKGKRNAFKTRLERLQLRTHLLLAALAGFRKRAHADQHTINGFQLRHREDDERRKNLPTLLHVADETRREMYRAEELRERIKTIKHWMETVARTEIPDMQDVYLRMIADYQKMLVATEARIEAGEKPRTKLVNDIFALTGMMSDTVEVEGRLERSIHAASMAAATADGQDKACGDVIRIHLGALREMHERDEQSKLLSVSLSKRDGELEDAEKALTFRVREHELKVTQWQREHEVKKDLDLFTTGLTNAKLGELDDVTRQMSELEGRTRGLETRLRETDLFLEEVRIEFSDAKSLLAEFRKSPLSLEGRIVQLVDYMKDLEKQLGIQRPSLFGDLPAASYGATGSKKPS